jgi:colanic acid/amylovoran biosynthesis glycosyltransferase
MTLRVAYLVNQYPKVSHSFIRREILALERRGVTVERIAVRGWDGELVDEEDRRERERTRYLLRQGLAGLLLPVLRALCASPARFSRALALAWHMGRRADRPLPYHLVYLAQACRLADWLRASGATHLHAHFGTNPAEVAMLAHVLGGPSFSFTVHGPEEFDRPQFLGLGEKLRRCAFAVAVSSYGRSQLYRWVESRHWDKIRVVHCGLEPAFHALPASAPPVAPRLVCVGRLCEQKGQLLLVQAAQRLRQRGIAFELVLAGDGEMRAEIEHAIAVAHLQQQVHITGWVSSARVREEMLASRAVVLASFAEGLPVVLMEAMSLRRPVVATQVAGIPELVRPGENGWLVPAGDADALAAAMEDCLRSDGPTIARMGESARQRVLERHDVDREAARLAALFGQGGERTVEAIAA